MVFVGRRSEIPPTYEESGFILVTQVRAIWYVAFQFCSLPGLGAAHVGRHATFFADLCRIDDKSRRTEHLHLSRRPSQKTNF